MRREEFFVAEYLFRNVGAKLGGVAVPVDLSGLAPGCVGLLPVFGTHEEAMTFAEANGHCRVLMAQAKGGA